MEDIVFSSPDFKSVDLLIIAGEASGDEHSSLVVEGLIKRCPSINISALGGNRLKEKGAHLVYPLVDHAVVGLVEVLKNYTLFKDIFSKTMSWIIEYRPKVILLVDYPGFNLRIAKELKKQGISIKGGGVIKVLQYISPQLWAWKPKRRFKMEKILDSLSVLFPFEIDCYKDTALPVSFVGHPFADSDYISPVFYDPEAPLLILPGSRVEAVERILPVFLDSYRIILGIFPDLDANLLVPNKRIKLLADRQISKYPTLKGKIHIIENVSRIGTCGAWMSSGTMSLCCALAGIPGIIAYRAHPLTYIIGRSVVKVPYLGMANILLKEDPPYPEFLQSLANGKTLADAMEEILLNKEIRQNFKLVAEKLLLQLRVPKERGAVEWLSQEAYLG